MWEGRAVPQVLLGGDHQKIDAWRGEQSRERTRLRRPELYEKWYETHPVTELPKWKRGENMRLVKTDEQFAAAARIFVEGRRTTCAENWTPEYCASLNEEEYLLQLRRKRPQAGCATCTPQGCAGRHREHQPQGGAHRTSVRH